MIYNNVFIYYYYYYCFLKNKNNRNTPPPNPPRPPQTHPFSTVTHPAIQPQQQIKPTGNLTNILTALHTHRKTHRPHKSQPTTGDPPPQNRGATASHCTSESTTTRATTSHHTNKPTTPHTHQQPKPIKSNNTKAPAP